MSLTFFLLFSTIAPCGRLVFRHCHAEPDGAITNFTGRSLVASSLVEAAMQHLTFRVTDARLERWIRLYFTFPLNNSVSKNMFLGKIVGVHAQTSFGIFKIQRMAWKSWLAKSVMQSKYSNLSVHLKIETTYLYSPIASWLNGRILLVAR